MADLDAHHCPHDRAASCCSRAALRRTFCDISDLGHRLRGGPSALLSCCRSIAWLELLKLLAPDRHARLGDFLVNEIGVYAGIALTHPFQRTSNTGASG